MRVVLDASTAVSWIVQSQATAAAQAVLADETITTFETPFIFPVELRNALLKLERMGRSDLVLTGQGLKMIESLDIVVRSPSGPAGEEAVMSLARETRLSFYDAHYLDLAERKGLCLVARDRALLSAARARGVQVRSTLDTGT